MTRRPIENGETILVSVGQFIAPNWNVDTALNENDEGILLSLADQSKLLLMFFVTQNGWGGNIIQIND